MITSNFTRSLFKFASLPDHSYERRAITVAPAAATKEHAHKPPIDLLFRLTRDNRTPVEFLRHNISAVRSSVSQPARAGWPVYNPSLDRHGSTTWSRSDGGRAEIPSGLDHKRQNQDADHGAQDKRDAPLARLLKSIYFAAFSHVAPTRNWDSPCIVIGQPFQGAAAFLRSLSGR